MASKSLDSYFTAFRKEYSKIVGKMQPCHAFTAFCAKYFYFADTPEDIDEDFIKCMPDGANDGGIDAIFANPSEGANELVVIQGKYYKKSSLGLQQLKDELNKIIDTLKDLQSHKVGNLNNEVKTAYYAAINEFDGEDYSVRIDFCTMCEPTKNQLKAFQAACAERAADTGFQIRFIPHEDILRQVVSCETASDTVDKHSLRIDVPGNVLKYGDSIVVNVSAQSLQELYLTYRNRVLGRNLRYHIKSGTQAKEVDNGISQTIKDEPENFWYLNNGILIACDSYELDGMDLLLSKFSIVNGGQTTYKIAHAKDLSKDFFVQCKVVVAKGGNETDRSKFCLKIANATNSQKPIKAADLRSNEPEQLLLKKKLASLGFYYVTKAGDKPEKNVYKNYQITNMDKFGKAALAGILLMPGTSRSSPSKMFSDADIYEKIFCNPIPQAVTDVLTLQYIFKKYQRDTIAKTQEFMFDDEDRLSVVKNAEKYYMACLGFMAKLRSKTFSLADIKVAKTKGDDELQALLSRTNGFEKIIKPTGDIQSLVYAAFDKITDCLVDCCKIKRGVAESTGNDFVPANYFKKDSTFTKDIIQPLWSSYINKGGKAAFDALIGEVIAH